MAGFEQLASVAAWNAAGAAGVAGAPLNLAAIGGLPGATAGAGQTLAAAAPWLTAGGTILTGVAGQAASRAEERELKIRAADERAAKQREGIERRRRAELLISRNQAVAADSGAGATDPTVLAIEGDLYQEGEYQAAIENYQGAQKADALRRKASQTRAEGDIGLLDSGLRASGTILSGISSYYDRYGRRGATSGLRYG